MSLKKVALAARQALLRIRRATEASFDGVLAKPRLLTSEI